MYYLRSSLGGDVLGGTLLGGGGDVVEGTMQADVAVTSTLVPKARIRGSALAVVVFSGVVATGRLMLGAGLASIVVAGALTSTRRANATAILNVVFSGAMAATYRFISATSIARTMIVRRGNRSIIVTREQRNSSIRDVQ